MYLGHGQGNQPGNKTWVGVVQGEVSEPQIYDAGNVPEFSGWRWMGLAPGLSICLLYEPLIIWICGNLETLLPGSKMRQCVRYADFWKMVTLHQ